jgi:hypothetical protein
MVELCGKTQVPLKVEQAGGSIDPLSFKQINPMLIPFLLIVFGATAIGLLIVWALRMELKRFRAQRERVLAKFGHLLPVTDEAFVAACSPGVNSEVALRVRDTIVDTFGVDPEMIHPDMELLDLEVL